MQKENESICDLDVSLEITFLLRQRQLLNALLSAGMELIFLPVPAVLSMLITLMFSVVAMKLRTFSSLPYSANEQVCRSWEGASPSASPGWPMEIFHTIDVMLSL